MQVNPQLESKAMDIPDHAIERIARCLLPRMLAYFESEEGRQELASEISSSKAVPTDASPCIA